jgi:hypothetical protein
MTHGEQSARKITQCPKCGSRNLQGAEAAYLSGVRHSAGGYDSISAFSARVTPPKPRSYFLGPLGWAYGFGFIAFFSVPYLTKDDVWFGITDVAYVSIENFLVTGCVSVLAFIGACRSAVSYNVGPWSRLYRRWEGTTVCRRCGHISVPKQ